MELYKEAITDKNNWTFKLAKFINKWGYKHLGKSHLEMHPDIRKVKDADAVALYTGLHKSLWETTGILVALSVENLPLPYTGMGDNLVRGQFFQTLAKRTGVFLIKRATNRREILESAKKLKNYVITFFAHGLDVLVFPEGTRKSILATGEYGKFFPTAFEASLAYEREKVKIAAEYEGTSVHDTYIVPVNVDYSRVREDFEMIESYKGKPRTLHVLDSLKMTKKVGDTYISFGEPIKVADHLDKSRKDFSVLVRERCLDLVKILPINVVSRAIVESINDEQIEVDRVEKNIEKVMKRLDQFKDRFRGFTAEDSAHDLLKKVIKYEKRFKPKEISIERLTFYRMYANFVSQYFDKPV